jgi:hypothetical protein
MADADTVAQIREESNELREAALRLREQAASLIEKAIELEQIARLPHNSQEQSNECDHRQGQAFQPEARR